MQNKINLDTHNELITVSEPWHRGTGFTWMLLALAGAVFFFSGVVAKAETVSYNMSTGNFTTRTQNTGLGGNGDPYAGANNPGGSTTEIEHYANSTWGPEVAVASFRTLTGSASGGTARDLKVGDVFTIIGYVGANPNTAGTIGISFNDGTSSSAFSNYNSGSLAQFVIYDGGAWKVNSNSGISEASGLGAGSDRTFTIKVTSDRTFNATIGNQNFNDLTFSGGSSATIDSFALWSTVGADGNGWKTDNPNSYWKNASLQNSGTVELGYAAGNGVTRALSGVISDGQALSSGSASANAVLVGGDAGSQVNLSGNNTYTGATTVNANATAQVEHANALGSTSSGTTVTSGGALKLYNASGISFASETLTLNGVGVNAIGGALQSVGGDNTWNGTITAGSNTRIAATTGSLTVAGAVSAGSNVLYLGTAGGNITVSGAISGAGASQDGTTTSLFKDGSSTLTLSGNNTYSGDTRITAGALTVNSGGNLGNGNSDVYVSIGATLNVNTSLTVDSVQETGNSNGGVIALGNGATLTIDGANKGTLFQNTISGSGNLTLSASGTTLSLYDTGGANTISGTFTISDGTLGGSSTLTAATYALNGGTVSANLGTGIVNANSGTTDLTGTAAATTVNVSGGTVNLGANNRLADGATVNVSSGELGLGTRTDTVNTLNLSGGSVTGSAGNKLTAGTYNLSGGTMGANLGTGTVNANSGTTALNGTVDATTVNVGGGTLNLGSGGRLAAGATANVTSGALSTGGNETITRLNATGGTVNLTGDTLTVTGTGANASSIGSGATATGGTISVSGTLDYQATSGATALSIASGGTLTGSGTTTGSLSVASGGTLSLGNSPGTLTVGNTTFFGGGKYTWEITDFAGSDISATSGQGSDWDWLNINGSLTIDTSAATSPFIIDIVSLMAGNDSFDFTETYTFAIATASSGITNFSAAYFDVQTANFANLMTGSGYTAGSWSINESGNNLVLTYSGATLNNVGGASAIPEPSVASMFVLGLSAVLANRRRRA